MAARRGESESINLISSTYSDDDDEMEDVEHQEPPPIDDTDNNNNNNSNNNEDDDPNSYRSDERVVDFDTPSLSDDKSRPLTPQQQQQQQPQISLSSPQLPQPLPGSDSSRSRLGRLTIVDYGHDEAALSPEAEDGEITGTGVVMIGAQIQMGNGDIQENTPTGTSQILTHSIQATTQISEQSVSHLMSYTVNESESSRMEEVVTVSVEVSENVDPLDRFLPPPPQAKCSEELQEKINKFLYLKRLGKSYNAEVRNKKEYRNPDFLLHAVTYQDIDQIGSCFGKDVFDPHGYDKSDYYDELGH